MKSTLVTVSGTFVASETQGESVSSASISNGIYDLAVSLDDIGEEVPTHPRVEPKAVWDIRVGYHVSKSGLTPTQFRSPPQQMHERPEIGQPQRWPAHLADQCLNQVPEVDVEQQA